MKYDLFTKAALIIIAILLAPNLITSPAGAASIETAILGKWQEVGGITQMEFLEGGYILAVAGRQQLSGKYEFLNKNRLRIDYGGNVGAMIFEVSISGDEVVMTEPNGKVSKFKKIK